MTTSADIIAAGLYRSRIRHAFGVPGGEVAIIGLERAGLRFTHSRHENAAGLRAGEGCRVTPADTRPGPDGRQGEPA